MKKYTALGLALRIVLLIWPLYIMWEAWLYGQLFRLLGGLVILGLVIWWLVSYARAFRRQGKEQEAQRQAAAQQAEETKATLDREQRERAARQAEFERTHGRLAFRVAGVTFDNDDGSSRQRVLKEALANDGTGSVGFATYDYKGETAVRISYNDMGIGNVPKDQIQALLDVMDRITAIRLDVDRFRPEDNDEFDDRPRSAADYIYRAQVTVVYTKEPV